MPTVKTEGTGRSPRQDTLAEEWNQLLEGCPQATAFHRIEWLRAVETVFAAELQLLCGEEPSGCWAFPLFHRKAGPLRLVASPLRGWATPYLGPVGAAGTTRSALLAMMKSAARRRADYLEVSIMDKERGAELEAAGFDCQTKLTGIVPLEEGTSALWRRIRKGHRAAIKKAKREGVVVRELRPRENDQEFLSAYHQMNRQVYAKFDREPPFPEAFHREVWNRLGPTSNLIVLAAEHEGRLVAGGFFPLHGDTVHWATGASFAAFNHLGVNHLLQWSLIERAVERNLRRYDLVGLGLPGVGHFKRGFGPQTVATSLLSRALTAKGKAILWLERHARDLVKRTYRKFFKFGN